MWELIRGYLTFTRKERIGVLFLLLVIGLLFILPHIWRPSPGDPDPAAYEKLKDYIRRFDSVEKKPGDGSVVHDRYHPGKTDFQSGATGENHLMPVSLFFFDPNTLREEDWKRLGLPPGLVKTAVHYIEKGGRFRKKEDLKKLYGLRRGDYEKLLPYIRIPDEAPGPAGRPNYKAAPSRVTAMPVYMPDSSHFKRVYASPGKIFYKEKIPEPVDINEADSSVWEGFPGIGKKLATRIVNFREKLGGFCQVEQVSETFGLTDTVFEKMKPYLRVKTNVLHQIDLNNAPVEQLQAHPYIRWQLARAITSYRQQHGGFKSVDELLQIVTPGLFEKIKPYLCVSR